MVAPPTLALAAVAALAAACAPGSVAALDAAPAPRGGTVVVGADPDYPPYEFLDRDGAPAGFNVDLTRALAEVMGMQVEFRFGRWAEMRAALLRGDVDVLQGISWSAARGAVLDFAPPHAIVQHAIFARRGTPPPPGEGLAGLAGKQVIVFGGGIMDELLTADGRAARIVRTDTPADALRLLASGEGEYVALALLPGLHIIRENRLTNVEPVARRVAAERYGFAVRKGNQELLARLEEGLAILKQTGRYQEIQARWLGVLEPQGMEWRTVGRVGVAVLLPLLLGLAAFALWSWSLRRQVAQRTARLLEADAARQRAQEELERERSALLQADKMAALGLLVSEVAHEVNNPTGLILLNLATIQAAFLDARELIDTAVGTHGAGVALAGIPYKRMREELPRLVGETQDAGRRIKRFVEDLRAFGRRDDAPRHAPLDLNEVARTAARLVDGTVRRATRRFALELAPALPTFTGSAERLEQVVVNLLLNACQALPDPERGIRLSTSHDPARQELVLAVADEGAGIAPEDLARLSEPFFTTRVAAGGTGLGLAIAARIAREHRGRLEWRSTPGEGTTARLVLPLEATP
jgi:polar amino acid transport system substrate-binding protein